MMYHRTASHHSSCALARRPRCACASTLWQDDAADADGEAGGGPDLIGLAVAMTLRRQLDAINLHIQESIPDTIQEAPIDAQPPLATFNSCVGCSEARASGQTHHMYFPQC